jgi:hypothetical protein
MNERNANENTSERMSDRPPRDEADLDGELLPIDDTAQQSGEGTAIDDVAAPG